MLGSDAYVCSDAGVNEFNIINKTFAGLRPVPQNVTAANCTQISPDVTLLHIVREAWNDGPLLPHPTGEFVWAYGKNNHLPNGHIAKGAVQIDFDMQAPPKPTPKYKPEHYAHGTIMFITFGLVFPTGATIAAFFRERFLGGLWQTYHIRLQLGGAGLALIGFLIALTVTEMEGERHFSTTHSIVGVTTLGLTLVQLTSAFVRPSAEAPTRELWVAWHRIAGLSVLLGGLAAIALGALKIGLEPVVVYLFCGVAGTTFLAFAISKVCRTSDRYSSVGPVYATGSGYKVNDDFGNM